ncbi:MAG: nucleotidyltransferase family protein, partial [Planctomycetaceae bacterium]|nr:nucleotidyltransferase family protein [Planctomycetaceae bacterium]
MKPVEKRRLFAVIPAAGLSRRMGRPKLLLPLGQTTVIGRLLQLLRSAHLADILVLVRPDDAALANEVRQHQARVVQPDQPPAEMRVSVEHLLSEIEQRHNPRANEGWMLIPGDHPLLSATTLAKLIDEWRQHPDSIVVPVTNGRRGHPTLFPWTLAHNVRGLPLDVGVNHLLHTGAAVHQVEVDDPMIF